MAHSNDGELRQGALGPLAIAFFVVSAAGPLVAMAGGIPIAMMFGNGPGIPALFVAATLVLLAFSAGYTAMARDVRNAGAFYAFTAFGLGRAAGGAAGLIALLSYNAIQIGLYGLFGAAAQGLIEPVTHIHLPWWTYAGLAMVSIGLLGYRQVDLSAKVLGLLVAGEYLVVLALDLAITHAGGDAGLNLRAFEPGIVAGGSPATGLMLCFAAFVGFEATTIYGEEARDPQRTIPLATYASVLLIGVFYAFSTWAIVNGAGVDRLMPMLTQASDPTSLLFTLAERYSGQPLVLAMRVLYVTSAYASLLAFHNAIARYFFAMGRGRLLPKVLARTHERFASPHIGSMTQTGLAAGALILLAASRADPILVVFTLPSAVATLGIVVLMALSSAAAVRHLAAKRPHMRLTIVLSALAFIAFAGIAGLATVHFDVLAGSSSKAIYVLPLLILAVGAAGAVLGQKRALKLVEAPALQP
ncbi:amino acid transporter [Caulobacter sp. AP07]|uniref:APC family permease n=1 Tax=Caulobacter sp. AP07 TaxID=1144304 RepID=UPI000271E8DE|nr:APC family permease [Caulobacter sp. AP07]EJL30793.1 amino acid transporter [Caulobacter sp. AP07]